MTKRTIQRNRQGLISGILEEDGQLTVVQRDRKGRPIALVDDRPPAEPPATAEALEHVSQELSTALRTSAEVAEIAQQRTARLERQLADATTPPAPASWSEYHDRVRRLSTRLGNRRDGGGLHLAVLGATTAAEAGDVVRACELLRGAEGEA